MTEAEENRVVEVLEALAPGVRDKLAFLHLKEAKDVAEAAQFHHDLDNFFSKAHVIDLGSHDLCHGFVVRVVSASDGAVGLLGPGGRCYRIEKWEG